MGWTKPQMNGALSVGLATCGLASYGVGRWIDRHGGQSLMAAGAVIGAVSLALWAQVTMLWQLYAVWLMIGIASAMVLYEAAFAATARMIPHGYRRAITAITLLGGLASTAFIPLTFELTQAYGWRQALLLLAFIELGFCFLLPWFALRDGPDRKSFKEDGLVSRALLLQQIRREPAFWLLIVS
jgi:MFS family permease